MADKYFVIAVEGSAPQIVPESEISGGKALGLTTVSTVDSQFEATILAFGTKQEMLKRMEAFDRPRRATQKKAPVDYDDIGPSVKKRNLSRGKQQKEKAPVRSGYYLEVENF